jgi:hypothetical protein
MSVIVALIVFVLIVTVSRNCLVELHFIMLHAVLFLVIFFLARGLCVPCVLVQSDVVLLLIVALFLIPKSHVLIVDKHYKLRANTDELVIKIMSRMLRKNKECETKESDSNKLSIDNISGD